MTTALHPAGMKAPLIVPVRPLCKLCRRPVWEDADEHGKIVYRHMVASYDMVQDPFFHAADLFVPEKLMDVVHTYGRR